MRTIFVRLPHAPYRICVGRGLAEKLPSLLKGAGLSGKVLVVTERRAASFHLSRLTRALSKGKVAHQIFFLPEGERAKRPEELFRIYGFLLKNGFERNDALIALGGGAVGDVAGFSAATYLRGIPLVQIGTTLLAQVDSSIGGKTGINLSEGKNLVGSFYQPRLVVSDIDLLKTLPRRELVTAFAEVIKYGMIREAGLFHYLERHLESLLDGDLECLENVVFRSAAIKARIVCRDEKETRGERMILNYGHTFGHAFEAASKFRMPHGEAVALGMVSAARLAVRRGLLSGAEELRQNRLIERAGLPTRWRGRRFGIEEVLRPMLLDKKKKGGRLRFVLAEAIGRVRVVEEVPLSEVRKVLSDLGGN